MKNALSMRKIYKRYFRIFARIHSLFGTIKGCDTPLQVATPLYTRIHIQNYKSYLTDICFLNSLPCLTVISCITFIISVFHFKPSYHDY